MKSTIGILFAVISTACGAQELQVFKLEVTQAELNVISDALGEVQYKRSAPLIQKLNAQIIEQIEAAAKAKQKPETKK